MQYIFRGLDLQLMPLAQLHCSQKFQSFSQTQYVILNIRFVNKHEYLIIYPAKSSLPQLDKEHEKTSLSNVISTCLHCLHFTVAVSSKNLSYSILENTKAKFHFFIFLHKPQKKTTYKFCTFCFQQTATCSHEISHLYAFSKLS